MQGTKAKQTKTNNKGITLVALVITVIVLLILAAVGIGAIAGPEGLIAKAKQAAEGYNEAAQDEAQTINEILNMIGGGEEENLPESSTTTVTLEPQFPKVESDNICPNSFKLKATGVDAENGIASYKFYINGSLYSTQETTEGTCVINVTGLEEETSYTCYVVVTNGAGEIKASEEIEVKTIASVATIDKIRNYPLGYYGKEVTFTPQNGAPDTWKIFYADSENIYLIADDYIKHEYVPNGKDTSGQYTIAPNKENTDYRIYFSDIVESGGYTGTTDIQVEDERVKKWISHINSFTSTEENMKATAYLLDTEAWSVFKDSENEEESKVEYVIGGPTLELFIASYNNTHETDINYEVTDATGYKIKWSTDSSYDYDISGLDTTETLYINDETDNRAWGYWLASPSATSGHHYCLFIVICDGYVFSSYSFFRRHMGWASSPSLSKVWNPASRAGKREICNTIKWKKMEN